MGVNRICSHFGAGTPLSVLQIADPHPPPQLMGRSLRLGWLPMSYVLMPMRAILQDPFYLLREVAGKSKASGAFREVCNPEVGGDDMIAQWSFFWNVFCCFCSSYFASCCFCCCKCSINNMFLYITRVFFPSISLQGKES